MRGKEKVAAALMVGILTLTGCKPGDVGQQTPLPAKTEQASSAESAWNNLSPLVRIDRLEEKNYPGVKNFDSTQALIKATSEFYCQNTPCKITPEEMEQNVVLLQTDEFLQAYQKDMGRSFKDNAEKTASSLNPELMINMDNPDRKQRKILIQMPRIKSLTKEIVATNGLQAFGGRDPETITLKSVLRHAYSHENQSSETIDLPLTPIIVGNRTILINRMEGLDLLALDADTKEALVFTGTAEGMTERAAIFSSAQTDVFILSKTYINATTLVDELNKKAGISQSEFMDYYLGKQSIMGLLQKWGSIRDPKNSDIQAGIRIYFLVAISLNNPLNAIQSNIEQEIGQKLTN